MIGVLPQIDDQVSVAIDDASLLESRAIALASGRNDLVDLFRLTRQRLEIRRQIAKVGARLDLRESRAVAHIPKIEIGRVLHLHAQRGRSTQ